VLQGNSYIFVIVSKLMRSGTHINSSHAPLTPTPNYVNVAGDHYNICLQTLRSVDASVETEAYPSSEGQDEDPEDDELWLTAEPYVPYIPVLDSAAAGDEEMDEDEEQVMCTFFVVVVE
jgi:hypothetical protein